MEPAVVAAVLAEYPDTSLLAPTAAEIPVPLDVDTTAFQKLASANEAHVTAREQAQQKLEAAKKAMAKAAGEGAGEGAGAGAGASDDGSGVSADAKVGAGVGRPRGSPPVPPPRRAVVTPTQTNGGISAMVMDAYVGAWGGRQRQRVGCGVANGHCSCLVLHSCSGCHRYGVARPAVERTTSGKLKFQHIEVRSAWGARSPGGTPQSSGSGDAAAAAPISDTSSGAGAGAGAGAAGARCEEVCRWCCLYDWLRHPHLRARCSCGKQGPRKLARCAWSGGGEERGGRVDHALLQRHAVASATTAAGWAPTATCACAANRTGTAATRLCAAHGPRFQLRHHR